MLFCGLTRRRLHGGSSLWLRFQYLDRMSVGSVRTDQMVVYGLTIALLPLVLTRVRFSGSMAPIAFSWLLIVTVASVGWLFQPSQNIAVCSRGSAQANFDNFLLPIVAILLVFSIVTSANRVALVQRFCSILIVGMCANTLVAVAQLRGLISSEQLIHFWSSATGDVTADRG